MKIEILDGDFLKIKALLKMMYVTTIDKHWDRLKDQIIFAQKGDSIEVVYKVKIVIGENKIQFISIEYGDMDGV